MAYLWRKLTDEQRKGLLLWRRRMGRPWHLPPHYQQGDIHYHLVAACYEHQPHIGQSPERMVDFSRQLLAVFDPAPVAWCVLPNHYHVLVRCADLKATIASLGRLHGRTSHDWNGEESCRGRRIWHGVSDRAMRGPDHFWATVNYIHHNPVKHGYVSLWGEWPFSSASDFLESVGHEEAKLIWESHPVLDYGKGWDEDAF